MTKTMEITATISGHKHLPLNKTHRISATISACGDEGAQKVFFDAAGLGCSRDYFAGRGDEDSVRAALGYWLEEHGCGFGAKVVVEMPISLAQAQEAAAQGTATAAQADALVADLNKACEHTAADYGRAMQTVRAAEIAEARKAEKAAKAAVKSAKASAKAAEERMQAKIEAEIGPDPFKTYAGPKGPCAEWTAYYLDVVTPYHTSRRALAARLEVEMGVVAAWDYVRATESASQRALDARQCLEAQQHLDDGRVAVEGDVFSQIANIDGEAYIARLDGNAKYSVAALVVDGSRRYLSACSRDAATLAKTMRTPGHSGAYTVVELIRVPRIR